MREFGLIGYPLEHSFSRKYFENKFIAENITDAKYSLFPLQKIDDIVKLIDNNPNLIGLNVTSPYKEQVIPFLQALSSDISELQAVNTIKIFREANKTVLKGYNTDQYGIRHLIEDLSLRSDTKALILGSGGSAKTTSFVLSNMGISFKKVSRTPGAKDQISYSQLNEAIFAEYKLIINTTPLGMYPDVLNFPDIPYNLISEKHYCVDLIYNPEETEFLKKSYKMGAKISNGLPLLHKQADYAWDIWNV